MVKPESIYELVLICKVSTIIVEIALLGIFTFDLNILYFTTPVELLEVHFIWIFWCPPISSVSIGEAYLYGLSYAPKSGFDPAGFGRILPSMSFDGLFNNVPFPITFELESIFLKFVLVNT